MFTDATLIKVALSDSDSETCKIESSYDTFAPNGDDADVNQPFILWTSFRILRTCANRKASWIIVTIREF